MKNSTKFQIALVAGVVVTSGTASLMHTASAQSQSQEPAKSEALKSDLISVRLTNIPVSNALSMIEIATPAKIIFGPGVSKGAIAKVELKKATQEEAIKQVAKASGLSAYKVKDGVYLVQSQATPNPYAFSIEPLN